MNVSVLLVASAVSSPHSRCHDYSKFEMSALSFHQLLNVDKYRRRGGVLPCILSSLELDGGEWPASALADLTTGGRIWR
jgi:hypothetical protein